MDLNYLTNEILPQREKEIEVGKNLGTRQPIYLVYDLQEQFCSGHSEYSPPTNLFGKEWSFGYIDTDPNVEDIEFCEDDSDMKSPEAVTQFFTDRLIAVFLTSKAAHEYLEYQSHNLTNPYVFVAYSGYGNRQMDNLLKNS